MFEKKDQQHWRDGEYLTTVKSSMEADIIESKLDSEGIPCIRRYKGAGNAVEIIMGSNSAFPIDIYVPAGAMEDAKNIIIPIPILSDDFDENEVLVFDDIEDEDEEQQE